MVEGRPGFTVGRTRFHGPQRAPSSPQSLRVLGFIGKYAQPEPRMMFFGASVRPDLDWLFE